MTEPIQEPVDADAAPDEGEPAEPVAAPEPSEEEQEAEEEHQAAESPEEPAEPQPQALSQKDVEKGMERLEREAARHSSRVEEIMGTEAAMLQGCPLCEPLIPGFVMPTPDLPERFRVVRAFMGDAQPRELRRDPNTRQCETCGGEGAVDTDSHVPGQSELPCTECGGKGWVGSRAPAPVPVFSTVPPSVPSNGPLARSVTHEEQAVIEELRAKGIVVFVPPAPPAPVP